MAINIAYVEFLHEQLSGLEGVTFKKMFGGVGFFKEGLMFAMVSSSNTFFLKVDELNKPNFEKAEMEPFYHPKRGKRMPYWTVPTEVIDDKELLKKWAPKSFEAALRAKKK